MPIKKSNITVYTSEAGRAHVANGVISLNLVSTLATLNAVQAKGVIELLQAAVEGLEHPELPLVEGYTPYKGEGCPVDADTYVSVLYRSKEADYDTAESFIWDHDGSNSDIVAYRVSIRLPVRE